MATRLTILACLLLAPLCAHAADLPKQGTTSYTASFVQMPSNVLKQGDRVALTRDFYGITRNDEGAAMWDAMGVHCLGIAEGAGDEYAGSASCVSTDKDGDQIFATATGTNRTGTLTYFGGTGKYAGITGKGDYVTEWIKGTPDHPMFVNRIKASWKLP